MSFPALLAAALEGSRRAAVPSALPETPETTAASAEQRLLRAAAFESVRRLAGRPAERTPSAWPTAPQDTAGAEAAAETAEAEAAARATTPGRDATAEREAAAGQDGTTQPATVPELRGVAGPATAGAAGGEPAERTAATLGLAGACAPETVPVVSAAAAARLVELLGSQPELLPEWFALARANGRRIPHALLPEVLDYVAQHHALQDHVMDVGGERLGWLASQNPAWEFAAALGEPRQVFETGSLGQRRNALRALRRSDPSAARALLVASWSTESAAARVLLLPELATGLGLEDQALLEEALHDRRKEVRTMALDLLRRLPGSDFGRRWAVRAQQVIRFAEQATWLKKFVRGGVSLEVREPREVPPEWIADGLDPRPPQGTGATAWVLRQVVALAPPNIWPQGAVQAMLRSDWREPLLIGLGQSAAAYGDADWCEALLLEWAEAPQRVASNGFEPVALLSALPPARQEAVLARLLEASATILPALAGGWTAPWSEALSRRFVRRAAEVSGDWKWPVHGVWQQAALRLDPAAIDECRRVLAALEQPSLLIDVLHRTMRTLEVRARMRREFR